MRVVTRVIVIAYFLDVGVLLTLAPWSALWEHNYFIQAWPSVAVFAGNHYVRGAISGLGLLNLGAACAEVLALFRRGAVPDHPVV